MDSLKKLAHKNYLSKTSNILERLQEIQAIESFSKQQIEEYQKSRLFNLLNHSKNKVPYYKDILNDLNSLETFDFGYLKKIPFLTKDLIKQNFQQLSPEDLNKTKYYINSSSGSTGVPAKFIQDLHYFEYKQATKFLFNQWCGCHVGDRQIIIWGSTRDIFSGKNSLKTSFGRWIRNEIWLNAFQMPPGDLPKIIDKINSFRPKLILSYVDSIYDLARYVEKTGLEVTPPGAIMVTAGTLTPEIREKLTQVFQTEVFNRYGSREVGDIACECDQHMGLHVVPSNLYVEILASNGEEVGPGQTGEIVVTSLNNYSMPLIRYKIGDMGSWANKSCSCGRNWPLLEQVSGRISDVFVRKDGMELHGGIFAVLLFTKEWIQKFQVVQEDYEKIKIYLVIEETHTPPQREFDELKQKIKGFMGETCDIEFLIVENIPKSESGKFRYLISNVRNKYV
jgi:phenylacetate-CoA ligase